MSAQSIGDTMRRVDRLKVRVRNSTWTAPAVSRYSSVDSIGEDRCFDSSANAWAALASTRCV
jgi:hypothetical protein